MSKSESWWRKQIAPWKDPDTLTAENLATGWHYGVSHALLQGSRDPLEILIRREDRRERRKTQRKHGRS